jgi:hypothetical protein
MIITHMDYYYDNIPLPKDILIYIFSLLELEDCIKIIHVCKTWFNILDKHFWRYKALEFWNNYKKNMLRIGDTDNYDLEWVQKESGKSWLTICTCLGSGKICTIDCFPSDYSCIWIGFKSPEDRNGWGIHVDQENLEISNFENGTQVGHGRWLSRDESYIGNFSEGCPHGPGSLFYNNGLIFKGNFDNGDISGLGSLMYWDGIEIGGIWNHDLPLYDPSHPNVKSCISRGICTNYLEQLYPQFFGIIEDRCYCRSCWTR